jgi:hypothetical protein
MLIWKNLDFRLWQTFRGWYLIDDFVFGGAPQDLGQEFVHRFGLPPDVGVEQQLLPSVSVVVRFHLQIVNQSVQV